MSQDSLDLDYQLAIKRLCKDMRDEWFSDPIFYKDFLDKKSVKKYFSTPLQDGWGQKAEQFNLPKAGFILRYSLETFIYDRLLYQAIADKLIEEYDQLLCSRTYSHRLRLGEGVFIFHKA